MLIYVLIYVLNVAQFKGLSFPVLFQAASACQLKLESEVSIFFSMVKNEDNSGESPGSSDLLLMQFFYRPSPILRKICYDRK